MKRYVFMFFILLVGCSTERHDIATMQPNGKTCGEPYPIKGVFRGGIPIYYASDDPLYDSIQAFECYRSEKDALDAGYGRSQEDTRGDLFKTSPFYRK